MITLLALWIVLSLPTSLLIGACLGLYSED